MKFDTETVIVLYGGQSGEREVSLRSATRTIEALEKYFRVTPLCLEENQVPNSLSPEMGIVFPLIHGDFGEDGQLQAVLEERGFAFVGSGSLSSALCMNKVKTKRIAQKENIETLPTLHLPAKTHLSLADIEAALGKTLVIKPTDKGSSIGVKITHSAEELQAAWTQVTEGDWMLEPYVKGRELTIGILNGKGMGVVEIVPKVGFYDYHNKYTPAATEYIYPAQIPASAEKKIRKAAEIIFDKANCIDFARADFILDDNNQPWFLEMNTIPGMTAQSLFPKSASCEGYSFEEVLRIMVESAIKRFIILEAAQKQTLLPVFATHG